MREGSERTEDPTPKEEAKEEAGAELTGVETFDDPIGFAGNAPAVSAFRDHFTLQIPTSTVRYRNNRAAARILETTDAQFVLEETYNEETNDHKVEIRRIHNTTEGVRFLRIGYALVTAFWTGFLFVFCLQVILFLILDLAIESGATSKGEAHWGNALGVILALPSFVHGCASAMVIAGSYIQDTIQGHYLIRNFAFRNVSPVIVEWIFFSFFLGLPMLVMCFSLLSRSDNWFTITLLFWFSCVLAFFVLFTVNVVWYELKACYEVLRNRYDDDNDGFFHVLARCVHLRQVARFGGTKTIKYLSYGSIEDSEETDKDSTRLNAVPSSYEERISWLGKLTVQERLLKWGCFEDLAGKEKRVYSIDDARDVRPYITSYTWNLEKIFCRRKNSRYIAIVRGPGAVTKPQLLSSVLCSFIGSFLIIFITFSLLYYLGLGVAFSMFMTAIGVALYIPAFRSTWRLYQFGRSLQLSGSAMDDEEIAPHTSLAVYLVEEFYRISQPTNRFSLVLFALEICIFFLYPFFSLLSVKNFPLAMLFLIVSGVSLLRNYFNAATVLEECGRMDLVDASNDEELWKSQSRLNEIIGNITRGRSRSAWTAVLGFVCFVFLGLLLGAVGSEVDKLATFDTPYTYTYDFKYEQKDSLRYPTCQLTSDLGGGPLTTMADYTFLAGLAYRGRGEITNSELDAWFNGQAQDEDVTVQEFRDEAGLESAVSFKLVSFPDSGNFSYVLIRGTTNNWDMLTDAQLWTPAVLMQGLRELLPMGYMWNPVIDELIKLITKLESESINRVSFYQDTTRFVEWLQAKYPRRGLGVTGHSLGGGLSIITGAQTGIPAVALSGPNAMLSRKSFDPPISREDLDSKTFNIIPSRDMVPLIDDPAQNYQLIRCETEMTDVVGCHDSTRSLCEIIFTCGSGGRPVPCDCVTQYGFPEPVPVDENGTSSFQEVCSGSE